MIQDQVNLDRLQETIQHRLAVFGVPKYTMKPFASLVCKWVKCSGVEWTVKRLKSIKTDLYRKSSGLPSLTWLAKNQKGNFTGTIGSLFAWASKSPQNFEAVVHTLMVYSLFKHFKLSSAQEAKFVQAVTAQTNTMANCFYDDLAVFIKAQHFGSPKIVGKTTSLVEFRGSPSKKAPIYNRSSMSQEGSGIASASYFEESPIHYRLYEKYKLLYGPVMEGISLCDFNEMFKTIPSRFTGACPWDTDLWGGEVHFLQEPGLKLRAIASPYIVHQLALKPLGDTLYSFMRTLPWDCTHDHKRPVSAVQKHLANHQIIHSVDLSNATDYFPLKVQLVILRSLFGNHPSIDLFEEISRSKWKSSIGPIQWSQGQPLGLYPSFASFGISHGMLLYFLNNGLWDSTFYVLGDDVIILDTLLYEKYIRYMGRLGCPISSEKSISSNSLCEFAGKILTSERVIPSYKWREVSNDNFLDIVRNYGRKAVSLLSAPQKAVVRKVQHCVAPFGLNWSYPNSNLDSMVQLTDSLYKPVERVEQSLTGLFRIMCNNYYSCPSNHLRSIVEMERIAERIRTFDEKVAVTLMKFLPINLWKDIIKDSYLYGGFSGVPRALGNTDLPPETLAPSRVTTLDWYRNILDL